MTTAYHYSKSDFATLRLFQVFVELRFKSISEMPVTSEGEDYFTASFHTTEPIAFYLLARMHQIDNVMPLPKLISQYNNQEG